MKLLLVTLLIAAIDALLWLPLGDSITFGCGTDAAPRGTATCSADAGGYRVPLAWALSQAGRNVTTMGTETTGPSFVPGAWLHHEGHPGWRIDQIDAILNKSLATSATPPDVITIHLGTNDCGQGATLAVMLARMQSLLSHIQAATPKTTAVFVASIIAMPSNTPTCAVAFNQALPQLVASFAQQGMRAIYTPMNEWAGLCYGPDPSASNPLSGLCCGEEVHPTAAGYLRMASAFALSIAENALP